MQQRLESIGTFVWNSEEGTVLGRGGKSWAEIGLFYFVYYACLASFFAATLAVFYETVSDTEPKLLKDSSLLDGNPGMAFRPRVDLTDPKIKVVSTLGENGKQAKSFKSFLDAYNDDDLDTADCSQVGETRPGEKEPCKFDMAFMQTHCNPDREYGFADGKPCVALKLNKVYGWVPSLWEDEMSSPLKEEWDIPYVKTRVPIRCYPKEKFTNKPFEVSYHPEQGFPISFFPYENQKDYRAPLVMVKFDNITLDKTIEVECRAYAKNINYEPSENSGMIRFKIIVD